jgi:recombination protein RecR
MQFSSQLLEKAVNAFAQLPGVGKKSALRLALHILNQPAEVATEFSQAVTNMRQAIQFCNNCHNIADSTICSICANAARKHDVICVVESIKDVMAIENTQQYNGGFHVLGGVISPLDGVGPDTLNIESLIKRIESQQVKEIIFALNPNIQGDTTVYYITKKLAGQAIKITTIARGIAFGGELEYADEMTLAKSIANRIGVDHYIQH